MLAANSKTLLFEEGVQEENKLAENNEVVTELKEEEPRIVGDAKSPDEEKTVPPEDVLAKADNEMGDGKLGRSVSSAEVGVQAIKETEEIGQKEEGKDSPSVKAADDQPEGLKVPIKEEDTKDITGGETEVDKDSQSIKSGKKEALQKGGPRVRMKSEEITDIKLVERDIESKSVRSSISSKISGFSADTRSLALDDSTIEKKNTLNMDHELLSVDIADVNKDDSDSDSSSSFQYEANPYESSISLKPDFLLKMEISLPSITEIRGSSSEDENARGTVFGDGSKTDVTTDLGKFVNPLTGEDISSSTESTESHKASHESEERDVAQDESSMEIDIEIQSIGSDKEKKVITMEEEYETALEQFEQTMLKTAVQQEDDIDLAMEARNQLLIYESTMNFLRGLIDRTVLNAETIDENAILEASLDKQLVLDELYAKVLEYENERRNQQYLSTKIIEHYRRIKNLRPILVDPAASRLKLMINFRKSLEEFDFLLEQKKYVMQMHNESMSADTEELIDTDDLLAATQKKFEQLIINTFIKSKSSAKWKSKIEKFLTKVDLKLKEISAERLILIRKQHTMAEIMEKMEKVENITPSFTMSSYERTIANVMKLGALLHDYNVSVGKVRKETCNYWHLISHMREHRNMLQIKIYNQTENYDNMCEKHKNMRDYICKLKVKHVALQHELGEISFNVGLLDKPLLMHDYDNTKDAIDKLTVVVDDLRKQYERIQKASELRVERMKRRTLKKSESKSLQSTESVVRKPTQISARVSFRDSSRISEKASLRNSSRISENASVGKSTRFNENVLIGSAENSTKHFKTFKFD